MSSSDAAQPSAVQPPVAAPPMKVPVKLSMPLNKIPMKAPILAGKMPMMPSANGPMKVFVKAPVTGPPASSSRPAGSAPPATSVPKPSAPARPAAAPKPKVNTIVHSNLQDEDEDDAVLFGAKKAAPVVKAPPPPARAAAKRPPQPAKRTRARSPSKSSSSSGSDSDENERSRDDDDESVEAERSDEEPSDPDEVPLFTRAKQSGFVPDDISQFLNEEEEAPTGNPPRPKPFAYPTGSLESALERARVTLQRVEADARIKDNNKTVALGTSKTNYIDPRIVCAWAKKYNVNASRVLNKSLREKFPWAAEAPVDFKF